MCDTNYFLTQFQIEEEKKKNKGNLTFGLTLIPKQKYSEEKNRETINNWNFLNFLFYAEVISKPSDHTLHDTT